MKNNNIDIYFFSGTGNTYLAAKKIAEVLKNGKCSVDILPLEISDPAKADLSKTIGLGFPTACWNTYPLVRNFFENLPKADGTELFIFTTMGDSSLKLAGNVADILEKKGYRIIGAKGFRMPNNFINVRPENENKIKLEKAYFELEDFASSILRENAFRQKTNAFFRFCYLISKFITGLWLKKISQKIIKFKINKTKCNACATCAMLCPTENIEIKDVPQFKDKCIFCLRCVSYCPQQALSNKILLKTYRAVNLKDILWKKQS